MLDFRGVLKCMGALRKRGMWYGICVYMAGIRGHHRAGSGREGAIRICLALSRVDFRRLCTAGSPGDGAREKSGITTRIVMLPSAEWLTKSHSRGLP